MCRMKSITREAEGGATAAQLTAMFRDLVAHQQRCCHGPLSVCRLFLFQCYHIKPVCVPSPQLQSLASSAQCTTRTVVLRGPYRDPSRRHIALKLPILNGARTLSLPNFLALVLHLVI